MDTILDFLADNYKILAIVSVVLLFALIGVIASSKKKKDTTKEDNGERPIDNDTNNEVKEAVVPMATSEMNTTSVQNTPVVEPSLDQFASNPTNVNLQEPTPDNEQPMLVIEDNTLNQGVNNTVNNTMTPPVSNEAVSEPVNEAPTLVLDDNAPSVGVEITQPSTVVESPAPIVNTESPIQTTEVQSEPATVVQQETTESVQQ